MIYRIDFQHFMTHAIDYFSLPELTHFQYMVVSMKIGVNGTSSNVHKNGNLYPTPDMIEAFAECGDDSIVQKMYDEYLTIKTQDDEWIAGMLYKGMINPLLEHYDVMLVCDRTENIYLDAIAAHMKRVYRLEIIDLNQLFEKGHVGPIRIDRGEIRDKAVTIRRMAGNEMYRSLSSTSDGRATLLQNFNRKEKFSKLKKLGIRVSKDESDTELDKLLTESWVCDEGD